MWFKLKATSCDSGTDAFRKYCKELSAFNVRMLYVPQPYYYDIAYQMDILMLVELNTLEDFVHLRDSLDWPLILYEDEGIQIEIYDDWRE